MLPCFVFAKEVYAEFNPYTSIIDVVNPNQHISYHAIDHVFQYDDHTVVTNTKLIVSTDGNDAHSILLDDKGMLTKGLHEENNLLYFYDDNGYMLTKSTQIDGIQYEVHEDGHLYDQEWKDRKWIDSGVATNVNEDTLLFVKDESGFYCLQANTSEKMINSSITLEDGREVRFDENGNIVNAEIYDGSKYYFPLLEANQQSDETYLIPVSSYQNTREEENVRLINHRGYHTSVPENTLEAFKQSNAMHYQYVETDVQMTQDQVPVLLHDGSLTRVAGVDVAINSITYQQAQNYLIGSEPITSLEAFIAYCKANLMTPYIELKTETIHTSEQIQMIYDVIDKYDMVGKITWISFSSQLLEYMSEYDTVDSYGYVVGKKDDVNTVIQNALALKQSVQNVFIDAQYEKEKEYVSLCQTNNMPLQLWGINQPTILQTLDSYVSGVTTDTITH